MEKLLLFGNEAIARGAFEAGVTVGTGYPGTPSSEILAALTEYPGVYTEWSVNEKVALEVGLGAAFAGARTLVTMKHVGVNVAADPLFTASYIGIKGGLVLVSADDPEIHSSQNEQDNRHYAYAAKVPMLDPSDSQEALEFTRLGFTLSEEYDTPVILRITTRIAHSKTVCMTGEADRTHTPSGFERNVRKYVMIPAYARLQHVQVEERMRRLEEAANRLAINRVEWRDKRIGIITGGISYTYVREVFPEVSILKLGMVHPLPMELIREFCAGVDQVFIVEELDPFVEMQVKAQGIRIEGKKYLPLLGELTPGILRNALSPVFPQDLSKASPAAGLSSAVKLPPRPPSLCPGCPHRTVFTILNKLGLIVAGDIGCYTLGVLPPFSAMDTCVDMGGSIGVAQGIEIAMGDRYRHNTVAVIGDSTFAHSGITGLLNAAYNQRQSLIIVLDNGTTAMTGMQPNPLSGERINGEPTVVLDYVKLAAAMGLEPDNVRIIDAYAREDMEKTIQAMLAKKSLCLLVIQGPCMILKRKKKRT